MGGSIGTHGRQPGRVGCGEPGAFSAQEQRLLAGGPSESGPASGICWMLFQRGQSTPRQLESQALPSPEQTIRFVVNGEASVLMLTRQELVGVKVPSNDDLGLAPAKHPH